MDHYNGEDGTCFIYRSPAWHDPTAPVIGLLHAEGHYQLLRWGRPAGGPPLADLQAAHGVLTQGTPRVGALVIDAVA